jgi:tetratricopeptide (TPR) repeat protein
LRTAHQIVGRLKAMRTSLRKQLRSKEVHEFARLVEDLGYVDYRSLEREKVDFARLVGEALRFYRRLLKTHGADAAALNNTGVLISNNGQPSKARPYFVEALRLAPRDATIHENLRIADILTRKPRRRWHVVPDGLRRGKRTFHSYFDPHAM